MKPSSRALALAALGRWRSGSEFADQIVAALFGASPLSASDRAFALELFYGVLRNLTLLDFYLAQLRPAPLDPATRDLLRLGLYQTLVIETAAHAAVFETVALAPARTRALVNAVLRRALRESAELVRRGEAQPLALRFSHPPFLVEKWIGQLGATAAEELCRWNNQPAPNYARINFLRISLDDFTRKHPASRPLPDAPGFVRLTDPAAALAAGDCYMQDPSTLLAPRLLAPAPEERVLDACAAPGGKTAFLAALMQNRGTLVGADRDPLRLERLRENLMRLGAAANIVQCDWLAPDSIVPGLLPNESFDKILLDVPCSNTGVMRRRVDVRWRLQPQDFSRMPVQQLAILARVAPLLRAGGALVYSTCSLEREENEEVVEQFLREHDEFRLTKSERSLAWRDGFDGAFAARLERRA